MLHSTFFFDYHQFQMSIRPVLKALAQENYQPLYQVYRSVVDKLEPNQWILQNEGTCLEDRPIVDRPSPDDIGYYILIFLSKFIERTPKYAREGFREAALLDLGWSQEDIQLLIFGNPLSTIVDEIGVFEDSSLLNTSYISPSQAYNSGWIRKEQTSQLLLLLDVSLISNNRYRNALTATRNVLQTAIDRDVGLLMIRSP